MKGYVTKSNTRPRKVNITESNSMVTQRNARPQNVNVCKATQGHEMSTTQQQKLKQQQ